MGTLLGHLGVPTPFCTHKLPSIKAATLFGPAVYSALVFACLGPMIADPV